MRFFLLSAVALFLILSWRAAGVSTAGLEPEAVKRCTHNWKHGYTWEYSLEEWGKITECVDWVPPPSPEWRYGPCPMFDPMTQKWRQEYHWILSDHKGGALAFR